MRRRQDENKEEETMKDGTGIDRARRRKTNIKKNSPGFENAVTLWQKKAVLSMLLITLKPL